MVSTFFGLLCLVNSILDWVPTIVALLEQAKLSQTYVKNKNLTGYGM